MMFNINLTEKSVEKIKELSEADGIGHFTIRVKVIGGGCAGFSHDMMFDDKSNDLDEIVEQDGVKLIIDPLSAQYLEGTTIDYLENIIGSGFKFLNPNAKGSCGCGSSITF